MVHPSYLLNPGDMFQVEIDKVLYGTGVQKSPTEKKRIPRLLENAAKREAEAQSKLLAMKAEEQAAEDSKDGEVTESAEAADAAAEGAPTTENNEETVDENEKDLSEEDTLQLRNQQLERLLLDVKMVLRDKDQTLTPSKKRKLRVFRSAATRFLSRPDDNTVNMVEIMEELQLQMQSLSVLSGSQEPKEGDGAGEEKSKPEYNKSREVEKALDSVGLSQREKKKALAIMADQPLSKEEIRGLGRLLKQEMENPVDETKPYATPWRPRPFMRAFAFIPRYLEVNPNICAAVYLRHPVARKGLAEVPTPFHYFTNQLAHNWYLGRG
jgi:ribosomal protein S4